MYNVLNEKLAKLEKERKNLLHQVTVERDNLDRYIRDCIKFLNDANVASLGEYLKYINKRRLDMKSLRIFINTVDDSLEALDEPELEIYLVNEKVFQFSSKIGWEYKLGKPLFHESSTIERLQSVADILEDKRNKVMYVMGVLEAPETLKAILQSVEEEEAKCKRASQKLGNRG